MALTAWQPVGAQPPFEVSYFGLSNYGKTSSLTLPRGKWILIPMIWGRNDTADSVSVGTITTLPTTTAISEETLTTNIMSGIQRAHIKKIVYSFSQPTLITINYVANGLYGYCYIAIPYNNYTLTKASASITATSNEVLTSGKYMVLAITGGVRNAVMDNTITVPSGTKLSEVHRFGVNADSCADAKEAIIETNGETITIVGSTSDSAYLTTYIYLIWKMS